MRNVTLELIREDADGKEVIMEVEVGYSYDPGCRTMRNGDPGWPSSEDIDIGKVFVDGKEADIELTDAEQESLCERAREAASEPDDSDDYWRDE